MRHIVSIVNSHELEGKDGKAIIARRIDCRSK